MAVFQMKNQDVLVEISEQASEITSFQDRKTGLEYMWQGDPAFWSGRNPTLFPMVGSTWNKEIVIGGKTYHMGNHGFARHSMFTCVEHTESRITMELKDSAETLAQYPFAFRMQIVYELSGRRLAIGYQIENRNQTIMPFNFGLHPAFNCPLRKEGTFAGCRIEFSQPETFDSGSLHVSSSRQVPLDRDLLQHTILVPHPLSREVSLIDGSHGVTVGIAGFEWVAFWSPAQAPFVCLEPWHSHTDWQKTEVPFEKREGTILLAAGQRWTTAYSIAVH